MKKITRIILLNPAKVNVYDALEQLNDGETAILRLRRSEWHVQPPLIVVEGEPISEGILAKIIRLAEPREDSEK